MQSRIPNASPCAWSRRWRIRTALMVVSLCARPVEAVVSPTFNRDVAPIVFQHCAPCHRPGGAGPFSLLDYASVHKRARQIVEVTSSRAMPPWLPEPGFGDFAGKRRLADDQIDIFRRWTTSGMVEGAAKDLPAVPTWPDRWQLGEPDLILRPSAAYRLGPDGPDLYRNFVLPVPAKETRYVRAVEFRPLSRSIHHVNMMIDQGGESRLRDDEDQEPGFDGMTVPARFPSGHLLNWVPGKRVMPEPDGLPWILEPDTDLVVQVHLQRSGKVESVQPEVGLYFTNAPPSKSALIFGLVAKLIDIPGGEANYVVERTFKLPVDVQVLAVLPHLHYLGKEVQGFATLPNGEKNWLLLIKHWNFNWQGEYRYVKPVFLPKGSILTMRYTYDNSAGNAHNPNHPPRRVTFGPQSTDEMGELWLQLLANNEDDLALLRNEKSSLDLQDEAAFQEGILKEHPDDASSHVELAKLLGPLGQKVGAAQHFLTAFRLDPAHVEANYYVGLILLGQRQYAPARERFENALRLNPRFYKAHFGLAMISLQDRRFDDAERELQAALRINPKDSTVRQSLDRVTRLRRDPPP